MATACAIALPPGAHVAVSVEPPRRRMAVHDVRGTLDGARHVRPAARAGDHDVGVDLPERSERRRIEREEVAKAAVDRESIEEAGADVEGAELLEGRIRAVERGVDRRRRPELRHLEHDLLGAAALVEVVVDDGDAAERPRLLRHLSRVVTRLEHDRRSAHRPGRAGRGSPCDSLHRPAGARPAMRRAFCRQFQWI